MNTELRIAVLPGDGIVVEVMAACLAVLEALERRVGGYRLVYVREEEHYFFLFAGTHDDCDRWLNNHRNLKPEISAAHTPLIASPTVHGTPAPVQSITAHEMDYDDLLMKNIDEKMLRRIFRGLCGEE